MYVSTTTNNPTWLERGLGALPGQVYVYVKPDGLSGGAYNGSLTLKGVYADGVTLYPNCQNQNLNIPVTLKINRLPFLIPIGAKTVEEGKELLIDANATDLDGESIIYTATGLPPGATIHPGTGVFKWTPSGIQAGSYSVTFNASDGKATDTEVVTITVNNDATPPSILTFNTPVISTDQSPTTGFNVSWNANDLASGIFGFQLQYRSNTNPGWTIFQVGGSSWYANKKIRFPGTAGKTYDFKVLAKDNDGNVSTSATKKTVVPLNQSVFTFSGWSNASSSLRFMGNAKYSTAEDSSASYHFTGVKEIHLILTFRPNGGKVDVFIGSTKIKTIDTYRATIKYRVAVRIKTYATATSGTIKAVNTHTKNASSSGYRVELDGIALKK